MTPEPPSAEQHCLVVYVPATHAEQVLQALGDAGAGRAGHYSHVAFVSPGTGRFTPLPGAEPAIGEVGRPEQVDEVRIETLYPAAERERVLRAMAGAHPYEVPAFATFPVHDRGPSFDEQGRLRGRPGPA
ncbi:hypothetical protein ACT4S2_11540 [Kocuria turfanensis]|uniref:Uncharacterized protein n=1 Tax=Kocuria turfanensis TaxID=388357 RepID=A0A512IBU1_9MICC|nr:hypothetical protein [Kocuria turfanensis]GEO95168.1 hypothetical protein KTU01_12910 [Kocuria turfanensis]